MKSNEIPSETNETLLDDADIGLAEGGERGYMRAIADALVVLARCQNAAAEQAQQATASTPAEHVFKVGDEATAKTGENIRITKLLLHSCCLADFGHGRYETCALSELTPLPAMTADNSPAAIKNRERHE